LGEGGEVAGKEGVVRGGGVGGVWGRRGGWGVPFEGLEEGFVVVRKRHGW
jgi:hypothetical protein